MTKKFTRSAQAIKLGVGLGDGTKDEEYETFACRFFNQENYVKQLLVELKAWQKSLQGYYTAQQNLAESLRSMYEDTTTEHDQNVCDFKNACKRVCDESLANLVSCKRLLKSST